MVLHISWHAHLLSRVMDIDVEGPEYMPEFDQEEASKSVNVLDIVNVAKLDVFVAVELPHCFIQEVLSEVALRHSDQELADKSTDRQFDVDVTVIIA